MDIAPNDVLISSQQLTVMLLAPGDVLPACSVTSSTSVSVASGEKGMIRGGVTGI